VVGAAAAGLSRLLRLHRLFDLGGVSGVGDIQTMFAAIGSTAATARIIFRRFTRRKFWGTRRTQFSARCRPGGRLAAVLAGLFDFVGAGRFPFHLLLLSRRVLQGVLGRPDQLRRRRAAQTFLGERYFPAHHPKRSPLFLVSGGPVHFMLSYDAWLGMWFTDATGKEHFGIGVGTIVLTLNAVFLAMLHFRLPLAAASDRRIPGFEIQGADLRERLTTA
jgi:hypothetical protein